MLKFSYIILIQAIIALPITVILFIFNIVDHDILKPLLAFLVITIFLMATLIFILSILDINRQDSNHNDNSGRSYYQSSRINHRSNNSSSNISYGYYGSNYDSQTNNHSDSSHSNSNCSGSTGGGDSSGDSGGGDGGSCS